MLSQWILGWFIISGSGLNDGVFDEPVSGKAF
jgi:hypothetical protein